MTRNRSMTIIAKDPALKESDGKTITTQVQVPWELLDDGPRTDQAHVSAQHVP